MLFFLLLDSPDALDSAVRDGVTASGEPLSLWTSLDRVPTDDTAPPRPVLVVDPEALPMRPDRATPERVRVDHVPASAFCNAAPYRPPERVYAGGGYVCRTLDDGDVAVLLIHRRGVWDLPKGKLDPGEDLRTCAEREVCEEIGVDDVAVLRDLGTTVHGYPDGDVYAVKETHWYLMQTDARTFSPETEEGIRRVAWARWAVARRHVGYATLRTHMDRVAPSVRNALAAQADG